MSHFLSINEPKKSEVVQQEPQQNNQQVEHVGTLGGVYPKLAPPCTYYIYIYLSIYKYIYEMYGLLKGHIVGNI